MKLKNIIKACIVVLILLLEQPYEIYGQQDPSFTMYHQNMNIINPAYVGSSEKIDFNFSVRGQWIDVPGVIETQSFSFSTPLGKNIGAGLSIVNDKVFVTNETDLYADFSYKLQLSDKNDLYLGLKAGGTFFKADLTSLNIENDPLFSEGVNSFNPNFGAGAYLKGEKYYASLSVPVILQSQRYEKKGGVATSASDKPHFYLGGGYTFQLTEDVYNLQLKPSTMVRYVPGVPVSLDLTTIVSVLDKVEFGTSYRIKESLSVITFFNFVKELKMGYAYEHSISKVSSYVGGTHEIIFKLSL